MAGAEGDGARVRLALLAARGRGTAKRKRSLLVPLLQRLQRRGSSPERRRVVAPALSPPLGIEAHTGQTGTIQEFPDSKFELSKLKFSQ